MAITPMLTNDALTVKRWSKMGWRDMMKSTSYGRMAQRGSIYFAPEFNSAQAGDQLTFNFTGILTGHGVGEGGTQVGNEEALNLNSYAMKIGILRHAVNNPNTDTIEQQRTLVQFEETARVQLPQWCASRLDAGIFNQLAGVNSTTITVDTTVYAGSQRPFVQGLNAVAAPTTNRIIRAGGVANDQSLTSTDTFTLDLIDAAVELAQRTYPNIQGLGMDGSEYDLYISPEQFTDLKRDTTGKIQWYQMNIAAMTGGQIENNKLLTAGYVVGPVPVGKYANVTILVSTRVANGQNSATDAAISTVRRAVMCGKNALAFGSPWGGRLSDKDGPFKIFTQLQDYDYYKGIEARMLFGGIKLQFNSAGSTEDFGSMVISTYAGSHSS